MRAETVDTGDYQGGKVITPAGGAMTTRKFDNFKTKDELEYTAPVYRKNILIWSEYDLIYKSGRELINYALYKHPRESQENYIARLRDGFIYNFGRAIINIFSFYLTEKEVVRELAGLEDDKQYEMFKKDCDLNGTDHNVFMNETQKHASAIGAIGILVNKPGDISGNNLSLKDEIKLGIYPYYAPYSLQNIFDWEFQRNEVTHRRELVFLKLRESDGTFTVWTRYDWQRWKITDNGVPEMFDQGLNPLLEIPFVWMPNLSNMECPEIGASDLIDVGPIVLSIAQNLSCGEEMIKLAGFPIMREPMEQDLLSLESGSDDDVPVGPRAVKEFDPQFGADGKPDWMPTQIEEPVKAALMWIDRKVDEIYRIAHLSGVHAQRKSNNKVASGLALRYELTQLNAVLMDKGKHQTEAELRCLHFWLKWQNKEDLFIGMEIKRSREFSTDEMAITLDNGITSMRNVASKTYRVLLQQKIASSTLPDLTQADKDKIETEIGVNTPEEIIVDFSGKEGGETSVVGNDVRNAKQANADHSKDGDKK
jgi:hypothetical protein